MANSRRDLPVPLSVRNISRLARQFARMSKHLTNIDDTISEKVADAVADEVRANVSGITDVEGNYDSHTVDYRLGPLGYEVVWSGSQIKYLEWGTGAAGASGGGDTVSMAKADYHPDPTKASWWYLDKGTSRQSFGWGPYAPMYNAATVMRAGGTRAIARPIVKGEVDAVTI